MTTTLSERERRRLAARATELGSRHAELANAIEQNDLTQMASLFVTTQINTSAFFHELRDILLEELESRNAS